MLADLIWRVVVVDYNLLFSVSGNYQLIHPYIAVFLFGLGFFLNAPVFVVK